MGEKTLIIPAAGKSSRFPNMRPKWLLTHPNGMLMIENVLKPFIDSFDNIFIVTTDEIDKQHDVTFIINQLFGERVKLITIPYQTKSPAETINYALEFIDDNISFAVKDSDSYVEVENNAELSQNFCVSVDVNKYSINNLQNKSFVNKDSNGIIYDINEKKISSNFVCTGVYGFKSSHEFNKHYKQISELTTNEIYISHIIYSMIANHEVFNDLECTNFKDWGTIDEWTDEMNDHQTIFCDFDGVLVKNKGKFGPNGWFNESDIDIDENLEYLKRLVDKGGTLIITTSRTEQFKHTIETVLNRHQIKFHTILCGLPHSRRILINDYSFTNPYPTSISINVERNKSINFVKL